MKTRFPLSVTDELFLHLEEADEPMSLQLDLRFSGRLDEQALELALFSAMKVHPLTSVRMHRRNGTEGGYEWEAVDRPDEDPVLAMDCGTDDAVETARNDFYSRRLSLESAPPFRCLIARHDGGDWLFLKMSHAVTDAPGSYRFLQSVLRRYAGISDSQPEDMDLINARDLGRQYGAKSVAERIQRDVASAKRTLEALTEAGFVEAHGATRGRTYMLSAAVYGAVADKAAYTRQAGFAPIQHEQMVLSYVRQHGRIKRAEAMELCRLSEGQVKNLLKRMCKAGLLALEGAGPAAHYRIGQGRRIALWPRSRRAGAGSGPAADRADGR